MSQHSTIIWRIDEIANSKPSEDSIGLFPLLWGFLQKRTCKCSSLKIINFCWLWHVSAIVRGSVSIECWEYFRSLTTWLASKTKYQLIWQLIQFTCLLKWDTFWLQTEFQTSCYKISNFCSKIWIAPEARILEEQNGWMVRIWKQKTGATSYFYSCCAISSMQVLHLQDRKMIPLHQPTYLIVIVGRLNKIIFSQTVQDARYCFCGRILRIFSSQFSDLFFKFSRIH